MSLNIFSADYLTEIRGYTISLVGLSNREHFLGVETGLEPTKRNRLRLAVGGRGRFVLKMGSIEESDARTLADYVDVTWFIAQVSGLESQAKAAHRATIVGISIKWLDCAGRDINADLIVPKILLARIHLYHAIFDIQVVSFSWIRSGAIGSFRRCAVTLDVQAGAEIAAEVVYQLAVQLPVEYDIPILVTKDDVHGPVSFSLVDNGANPDADPGIKWCNLLLTCKRQSVVVFRHRAQPPIIVFQT